MMPNKTIHLTRDARGTSDMYYRGGHRRVVDCHAAGTLPEVATEVV